MNNAMEGLAYARLTSLFDDGSFQEINAAAKTADGSLTGVICAYGYVNGNPVYAFLRINP